MASIVDVAKKAGVGLGTVSRVLNNTGYVSEKTRDKVNRAIKELNYVPNEIARSFKSQNSRIVALILPTIFHPLFSAFAFYLEKGLDERGFKLMICNSNFEPSKEIEFIELVRNNTIDGIIFISNSDIDEHIKEETRVLTLDRHFTHELAFISCDNQQGGELAAQKLIEGGSRKLAYVGNFPRVNTEVRQRRNGFLSVVETQEVEHVVFDSFDYQLDENRFAIDFISQHLDVDGVFALTDAFAVSLVEEYHKRGIRIPEDVQIIGFDGVNFPSPEGEFLSTIRQPVEELGALAAERIVAISTGREVEKRSILPVSFIKGQTTR